MVRQTADRIVGRRDGTANELIGKKRETDGGSY